MGGSAGNSNAQLFQLMSQYDSGNGGGGGGGGGGGPSLKDSLTASFADWRKSNPNGGSSVWAPWALLDSKGIGGDGGRRGGKKDQPTTPQPPATEAEKFAWQFPQYTQTWAFTPPTPTPYMYPQPFDTKIFGNPLPKKDVKKNR